VLALPPDSFTPPVLELPPGLPPVLDPPAELSPPVGALPPTLLAAVLLLPQALSPIEPVTAARATLANKEANDLIQYTPFSDLTESTRFTTRPGAGYQRSAICRQTPGRRFPSVPFASASVHDG